MDNKRKRLIIWILLATNLLLLYFYFSEPVYFLTRSGSDNPELASKDLIKINNYFSKVSEYLFMLFSISFMIYGLGKLLKRNENFSILLITAFFVVVCFLNIFYRFF